MADIYAIRDFAAPELDIYARLTENQLVNRADPENALFIAESPVVIERALDAGCVPVSFLMEEKHVEGKGRALLERCGDVPVYTASLETLTQLTGFHLTRGMLCAMRRPRLPDYREVCAGASRIAVLENVMNPTNIGAIFRSAAADRRRFRPAVPPGHPGQHGDGVPGALGLSAPRGRLGGGPGGAGLQDGGHGPAAGFGAA